MTCVNGYVNIIRKSKKTWTTQSMPRVCALKICGILYAATVTPEHSFQMSNLTTVDIFLLELWNCIPTCIAYDTWLGCSIGALQYLSWSIGAGDVKTLQHKACQTLCNECITHFMWDHLSTFTLWSTRNAAINKVRFCTHELLFGFPLAGKHAKQSASTYRWSGIQRRKYPWDGTGQTRDLATGDRHVRPWRHRHQCKCVHSCNYKNSTYKTTCCNRSLGTWMHAKTRRNAGRNHCERDKEVERENECVKPHTPALGNVRCPSPKIIPKDVPPDQKLSFATGEALCTHNTIQPESEKRDDISVHTWTHLKYARPKPPVAMIVLWALNL